MKTKHNFQYAITLTLHLNSALVFFPQQVLHTVSLNMNSYSDGNISHKRIPFRLKLDTGHLGNCQRIDSHKPEGGGEVL